MNFGQGTILELTDDQAKRRIHNLTEGEKGVYIVDKVVQFKMGEVIGYEGDIPKPIMSLIEPMEIAQDADTPKPRGRPRARK